MIIIKSIELCFPMSTKEEIVYYEVGKNEITKIEKKHKLGQMAEIPYYVIYKGDKLVAEMHHYSRITYFEE